MKLLCKMKGGSHSYGLSTPASDLDWRGVFINTDLNKVIGLGKMEHQQKQENGVDEVYTEFRNALNLLKQGNTQMIELLFADDDAFEVLSDDWQGVRGWRHKLVSSEKLFSCLRGYMQGELRLANGERTGKLGGKRKEAIDRFGYSPKNFVQLLRLARAGCVYFQEGIFPVNVMAYNTGFGNYLLDIKTNPANYTKDELNQAAKEFEKQLIESYESRKVTTTFDDGLADELCLRVYGPMIRDAYSQLSLDKGT